MGAELLLVLEDVGLRAWVLAIVQRCYACEECCSQSFDRVPFSSAILCGGIVAMLRQWDTGEALRADGAAAVPHVPPQYRRRFPHIARWSVAAATPGTSPTSISRAHPMRAHIVRSRGQVAVHSRTPAVAARMPPAVLLVINLRIRAAADCCCGSSSSLLLPDSVKPAVQRGVQNSRGFVPPEAERIRARRPELDGTTRLTETRGTGHGRATEREVASGASDKTTRKTRI